MRAKIAAGQLLVSRTSYRKFAGCYDIADSWQARARKGLALRLLRQ